MSKFAKKYRWKDRPKRFDLLDKRKEIIEGFETCFLNPLPVSPLTRFRFALEYQENREFFEGKYKHD